MSDPSQTREWNAGDYHRLSGPQVSWGKRVLAGLHLRGDEFLMDAGCGTGRLTGDLLDSLPLGQVVGVDLSQNMLVAARQHLASYHSRVQFVAADLQDLPFRSAFDGIFSTAAFHWVPDHRRLFASLYCALRPGGWLRAQCGGATNLARLLHRMDALAATPKFAHFFSDFRNPWVYNDAETAARLMREAGFVTVETSLVAAPTVLENAETYSQFLRTAVLRVHLTQISDPDLQDEFIVELTRQAATDEPPFSLDYWRLNLSGNVAE
jgi:trans-aconitate 2-methyltransferase